VLSTLEQRPDIKPIYPQGTILGQCDEVSPPIGRQADPAAGMWLVEQRRKF
jgi:hypothetical protein